MRKNKFIYTLSALMMACIISFSGVGGSYIQAKASSGIADVLWNTEESAWDNIVEYITTFLAFSGAYVEPGFVMDLMALDKAKNFYEFMVADGYTAEQAHDVLCDCGDSTHTSFTGNEHGGGGFIRDGISRDSDGNVTYSDEVSDLFHDYISNYLETECGYYVVETMTVENLPSSRFTDKAIYDNAVSLIEHIGELFFEYNFSSNVCSIANVSGYENFLLANSSGKFLPSYALDVIEDDWRTHDAYRFQNSKTSKYNPDLSAVDFSVENWKVSTLGLDAYFYKSTSAVFGGIFTPDGSLRKVWKSIDAFKMYDVGHQPYYVTQNWVNYDASQDNSVTITNAEYTYYNDNSTTIYQTIQNNIDNSGSDLTEADIQKIVEDAVKEIKDSIPDNSGSGDSGSGDNEDSGGTGVGDLIDGIGKIFDTILSLIGKLMGVVADFTQSILDLFSGFTTFTDGFSDFLAGAFSFIPPEVWDIVKVGLSLMVLLAVIKFLRK